VLSIDVMEWRRYYRHLRYDRFLTATQAIRERLKSGRYDMVLNLHADQWWATLLNCGSESFGLFTKKNSIFRRFYTDSIASTYRMHFTRHQLLMAELLECPETEPHMLVGGLPDDAAFLARFRREHELSEGKPTFLVSPFSSKVEKDWPPENFAALCEDLATEFGGQTILTHAPQERARAEALVNMCRSQVAVASGTSLLEYVALIRAADAVVCNDTSALHIAAATDTPVVAMYGPTKPEETEPLVGQRVILTPQNGSRNMTDISISEVKTGLRKLLPAASQ
jgi:ADP-heptose:LPS heptosyltransferase